MSPDLPVVSIVLGMIGAGLWGFFIGRIYESKKRRRHD